MKNTKINSLSHAQLKTGHVSREHYLKPEDKDLLRNTLKKQLKK